MKKKWIFFGILPVLILTLLYIFREPIMDMLPIDQSGWEISEEGTRYLNEKGDPVSGWQELDGARYFFHPDTCIMHTGWLDTAEGRFYLNDQGHMHTGWLEIGGNRHYLDTQGRIADGLLELDSSAYYLNADGIPQEGFFQVEDSIRYFTADGQIFTGWLTLSDQKYYLDEGAQLHTGWLNAEGLQYFFEESHGVMVTGWTDTPEGFFYFLPDGVLATGWTDIDGVVHCFGENGLPRSGWIVDEGRKYYLNEDGTLYNGWLEDDGKRYYLLSDGTPATGRLEIDGETYFFSSTGMNFIMVNPWNPLPDGFEAELVQFSGARIDPQCQEALEQMLADCRAAGYWPVIVSSYRSISDQTVNLQNMINSYLEDGYSYSQAYAIATTIVAVPGTSEHHLGLAVDIVDSAHMKLDYHQADMPAQKWLMENCWKYGFILRYPNGTSDITGIIYEPWHYRYVGVELALELQELGVCLEVYIDWLTNDGTTCGGKLVPME